MWNWCYVFDQVHFETCCLQGTNCCFTTSTRTFNHDFHRFHTVFHSRFGSCFSSHLRSERVDLREPLNPRPPELAQEIAFP